MCGMTQDGTFRFTFVVKLGLFVMVV